MIFYNRSINNNWLRLLT